MNTKKKTTTPKAIEPKPKYAVGATVYYITYHKGKPEELIECKITGQHTSRTKENDFLGKPGPMEVYFSYTIDIPTVALTYLIGRNVSERDLYANFTEAAKVFAKAFLFLLK
jgi:hypothetical protein